VAILKFQEHDIATVGDEKAANPVGNLR